MPQASQPHDTAYFDGSADPNPGGRIGTGWNIEYADGSRRSGAGERAPAPGNTNNVAEYLGLIAALEAYLEEGGTGPLLIHGDSQLVIMQMTGRWGINAPGLFALNERAHELAERVAGGVRYQWVRRERNAVADQLASGMRPGATAGPLVYAQTPPAGVPPRLAERIAALNRAGRASFKECMGLQVGGRDDYSALHLPELAARAGAACVEVAEAAFAGEDAEMVKARETALRWMLRGLAAQLAIRKVQVDREVSANVRR